MQREARMRRLNHYGPYVLGGAAILGAIGYEAARHHVLTRFDGLYFLCLVLAVVPHEMAHGVVAYWCGDDTAKSAGRLSWKPWRHVDPIGTLLLPALLLMTVGSAFGWARPVPVSINKLRHPRNQAVLVGLAGPATNILFALVAGFAFHAVAASSLFELFTAPSLDSWPIGYELLFLFGEVNVIIAAFNLIPIPPLDGSAVVERLLPRAMLPGYYRLRQASMIVVLLVVFLAPGVLDTIFNHALNWWANLVL